jgi:hypothetical protein
VSSPRTFDGKHVVWMAVHGHAGIGCEKHTSIVALYL